MHACWQQLLQRLMGNVCGSVPLVFSSRTLLWGTEALSCQAAATSYMGYIMLMRCCLLQQSSGFLTNPLRLIQLHKAFGTHADQLMRSP